MAQIRSTVKFARASSTKLTRTADIVRGQTVQNALLDLQYLPNRGAKLFRKCILSLVANAEDRGVRNVDNLVLTQVQVGTGPILRRIQPKSRGQAFVIRKRLCHVFVSIDVPEL